MFRIAFGAARRHGRRQATITHHQWARPPWTNSTTMFPPFRVFSSSTEEEVHVLEDDESSWNWSHDEDEEENDALHTDDDPRPEPVDTSADLTVKELKTLLAKRGLKTSGRKAELLERLFQSDDNMRETTAADDEQHLRFSSSMDKVALQKKPVQLQVPPKVQKPVQVQVPLEHDDEICFDATDNYKMIQKSILVKQNRLDNALTVTQDLKESTTHEAENLLALLPPEFQLDNHVNRADLMEVVLDIGRRPFAWVNGERHFLGTHNDGLVVSRQHLDDIVRPLHFGADNRAGINGSLHRISAVRNRDDDIVGLTLRVGRYIAGNSIMIADILAGMPHASILICGEPGSGKTSIIRDAARFLAERNSLLIIDTSCEIGGSGDVPHHCIGLSRRMQVKSVKDQAQVMVECVQNHTPAVMVIDEIGRKAEVQAALTCKERGVRIIASAHGNMPGLVRNQALCDLVGGIEAVTVGDTTARQEAKRRRKKMASKIQAQRRGPPIFDVIIEVKRGVLHEWHIVSKSADAVDSILRDGTYNAQVRTRQDSGSSTIRVRNVTKDAHDLHKIIEEATKSESILNSIPVTDDGIAFEDLYDKKITQCPACYRMLHKRRSLLNHIASKPECQAKLPTDLLEYLQDEAGREHGMPFC